MLKPLLIAATLAFSAGAAAQQYKWVDQNGRVQYGDSPPAGAKVSPLRPTPPGGPQPEAKKEETQKAPATFAEKEADFRKRQQDAAKEREKQAALEREAADKRENCTRAKEALRAYEGGRVARIDAKGERYFLDDAQLAQESARARQAAQQYCN